MESPLFKGATKCVWCLRLLCLVPAATFAAPIQLTLSETVISKQSLLTVVDVGDPFSALLTYDLPPGATKTSVSGFLYYKGRYRNAAHPSRPVAPPAATHPSRTPSPQGRTLLAAPRTGSGHFAR